MSFHNGYVLEPPRVGGSNSPFTSTPANVISNSGAYTSHYSSAENVPRTDYLTLVMRDGKLPSATFGWTKNEGIVVGGTAVQRFSYDSKHQRFYPLPGAAPTIVGVLGSTSNTSRLKVTVPIGVTSAAPFRLSLGSSGSGTTQTVTLVTSFGSPPPGTTELITFGSNAGQLNWNPADLTTYAGETVRWQQQSPFSLSASNGNIGAIGNNTLLLNPLPGTTQYPLIRVGYGLWLTAVEKPDESHFSANPATGTVEWALTTGLLKFNSTDISTNAATDIYYDGILLAANLTLPTQSLGTVNPSGIQSITMSPIPQSGGDIIFRVSGILNFEQATAVTSFDMTGKQGTVQYNSSTGQVLLSLADRTTYAGQPLTVTSGDLPIERGISMRFFRTPVDLAGTNSTVNDVSSIYSVTGATWASPVIQSPVVSLPSTPIDDVSHPITVTVAQGTGSFTGNLPNLQVPSPPAGIGYAINYDGGQLQYANRLNNQTTTIQRAASAVVLNPLIVDSQTSFAIETGVGSNIFTSFTESPPGSGVFTTTGELGGILDATSGQFAFTQIAGTTVTQGSAGSFSGTTFTDGGQNFTTDGVMPGHFLVVQSGASKGVYTIHSVGTTTLTTDLAGATSSNLTYEILTTKEVLADRYFEQVELVDPNTKVERINSLGIIANSPRLSVPLSYVNVTRFRFGDAITGIYSTVVNTVTNDGFFTSPSFLPSGTVEISLSTGNLNFSSADLTGDLVYWARTLTQNVDYTITPQFGTIRFVDRFLALEEALVQYTSTNDPTKVIVEPAVFLVRKELTQPHPTPTNTLSFNPLGRTVAQVPSQNVFRGGRPQVINTQCTVDADHSTITFLPDTQLSNALPHGAIVNPTENVYIDYYIYQALGGEQNITVQNPPMNLAQVNITEGTNSFTVSGDYAEDFPPETLLRIGKEQVYLILATTYAPDITTVIISGNFTDDYQDPDLYITSGDMSAYFLPEVSAYNAVARGMNKVILVGNKTSTYKTGSILLFTDMGDTFEDYYEVSGVGYDQTTNLTTLTITRNTVQQYTTAVLKHSVRPVLESTTTTVSTLYPPVATQPITVWRRIQGQVGSILSSADYSIDRSGNITLTVPLNPNEEVSIFYTGSFSVQVGLRFKSSYTYVIAPTAANGILNQVLLANYSTFNPDSFYYRVETMTNFRGELAAEIQSDAVSSVPSGGPTTSNSSQPQLYQQGKKSLYFDEGHYANEDIVARAILLYYNTAVNYLEDALHAIDGRVVGDSDGRFMFDGVIGRTITGFPPTGVLNQIDDLIQVSPFPQPDGTYQQIYLTGPYSRFFKSRRNIFSTAPALAGHNDNDPIGQWTFANLASLPGSCFKRWPRGQVQFDYPAGSSIFTVDNATGTNDELQRPSFIDSMRVVIEDSVGTVYLPASDNNTVASFTSTTITLSSPVALAVPAGATIYLSPSDANTSSSDGDYPPATGSSGAYGMNYQFGKDVNCNLSTGEIDYSARKFPFDGSIPLLPKYLNIFPVQPGDIIQANGAGINVTNLAPYRFSALDGGTLNDDGDQTVPIVGPTFDGELVPSGGGPLNIEAMNEISSSPYRTSTTTPPYIGSGNLDATKLIITLTSGVFPSPVPQAYDLVRIITGTNGQTSWHSIVSVTSNSVTVSTPFASVDTGFSFVVTVSSSTTVGTATLTGTTLTDLSAFFLTTATVGETVVMTSGPNAGLRRQIQAVVDNHHLTLTAAFTSVTGGTYRVDNPLNTYSGSVLTSLQNATSSYSAALTAENTAILNFLSTVFTTVLTSTTGTVTGTTLTDTSENYVTSEITSAEYIYVPPGDPNTGVYAIASVDSPTQITTGTAFSMAESLSSYQVVSTFGVSLLTLSALIDLYLQNETFSTDTTTFHNLLTTAIPVIGDSLAFAIGITPTDLDTRYTTVNSRISDSTGIVATLEAPLQTSDKLFDARYVWIDERINQKTGLLVLQQRAVASRISAQADILTQLTKLLAVQAS